MRKKLLLAGAALFGAVAMHGQAYVSVSGGYGFEINKKVVEMLQIRLQLTLKAVMERDFKRSYGEGISFIGVGEQSSHWVIYTAKTFRRIGMPF